MSDQIEAIHRSAEIGDVEGVGRAAHGLKSTAGAIGASRLLAAATAIEAIRAYARVVELWKDCDPELRSTWKAAQRAVERLTAETALEADEDEKTAGEEQAAEKD